MRTGPEPRTGVAASPDAAQHAEAIGHLLARIDQTADQIGDLFPLSADPQTGTWMTAPDGRWTGGFWCGQLWLALQASDDAKYRVLAENALQRLQGRLESDNVLNGLVFYYAAALGKQLHQSQAGAALGALGAEALARCFNPGAGFIPLGHDSGSLSADARGETNIDGVPGMSLLWWAARERGEPALAAVAAKHVRRHVELCMRPEGSLYQAALVDPENGTTQRLYSPRGYSATSTWARAQSWGLLGFVQAYAWTKDPFFGEAAVRAADWWLGAVPADRVAFWDFDDPAIPETERDTSATAMATAALLKLARLAPEASQRDKYADAGAQTLRTLVENYLTPTHPGDRRPRGMLTEGCWQHNQAMSTRHELVWGDYFLLESLLMASGRLESII